MGTTRGGISTREESGDRYKGREGRQVQGMRGETGTREERGDRYKGRGFI